MSLDPVAAGGFASAAPTYARIRPAYARAAIGELKEAIGTTGPVADVAAGTGILTGQLHRAGLQMLAVEPVPEMLAQLRRSLPGVPAARGLAESLPFADEVLDGVVVGEAFHWFDAPVALREVARVLRPGGVLAMLWNRRDTSVAADFDAIVATTDAFGPSQQSDHPNPQPRSPSGLADRTEVHLWRRDG